MLPKLPRVLLNVLTAVSLSTCMAAIPLAAGGCGAANHRFRVVDAGTGQPMSGVRATRMTSGHRFDCRLFPYAATRKLPETGADGLTGERTPSGWAVAGRETRPEFYFEKSGYLDLAVHRSRYGPDGPGWYLYYSHPDEAVYMRNEPIRAFQRVGPEPLLEVPMRLIASYPVSGSNGP